MIKYFSLLIFLLVGCTNISPNKIERYLLNMKEGDCFSLFANNENWDSLYIVKPYCFDNIPKQGITIPQKIVKKINKIAYDDKYYTILFINGKDVVNYSVISVGIANFSKIDDRIYPSSQRFYLENDRFIIAKDYSY